MQLGLKLFPSCLGAQKSMDTRLDRNGALLVLVIYDESKTSALNAQSHLESTAKIRGASRDYPLVVKVLSAAQMDTYSGARPAGIFIASVGLESQRLRNWSEHHRTLVFSPFADDVEQGGAVAGIHVTNRILPAVNLTQARRAGIRFKPYFLEQAKQYDPFDEEGLRVDFLVNLAIFIEWPASAFDSKSTPLRYCVLGNPDLSARLKQKLTGEKVANRSLEFSNARGAAQWRRCHLIYIDHRAAELTTEVLTAVETAPVLTVGDSDDFMHQGGIMSLIRKGHRLHPLIDREAAMRRGIQISSKLLRLATLVTASAN